MKKILCIALTVLFVCMSLVSYAEESDPIVGVWYIYYSRANTPPTVWDQIGFTNDEFIIFFDIKQNSEIFFYGMNIKDSIEEPEANFYGQWEKNDAGYVIKGFGSGEYDAYFKDDELYFKMFGNKASMRLRKIEAFDWYNDYIRYNTEEAP